MDAVFRTYLVTAGFSAEVCDALEKQGLVNFVALGKLQNDDIDILSDRVIEPGGCITIDGVRRSDPGVKMLYIYTIMLRDLGLAFDC